ncbi:hypothetical protein [Variovorax sp. GT1P44]|uniref:hypothetical protein n=1 Tax=Variovorax sp. GT1P44 TaxID=3443742 RepID=UPI003F48AC19
MREHQQRHPIVLDRLPAHAAAAQGRQAQVRRSDLATPQRSGTTLNPASNGFRGTVLQLQRQLGNQYAQRYVRRVTSACGEAAHLGPGLGVQRQPAPGPPAVDWRVGAQAFNLILQREFAVANSSWFSGTRSDLPLGGAVLADLTTGRGGRVQFALSPDFAPAGQSAADASIDPVRVAAVRTQVMRVFDWRIAQGILTGEDVAAPFVSARLRAMPPLSVRTLRAQPKVDPVAQAELDRILAITTQLPATAQFDAAGAASLNINGINVRILPDTRQGTRNETSFRLVPSQLQTPGFTHARGRVTAINGPIPVAPAVEIFTSYAAQGPQAGSDPLTATSAYGRGTTASDTAAGTTSLRFHESSHGADYLGYIAGHPFPTYTGSIGMTVAAFTQANTAFLNGFAAWSRNMGNASLCATDCVGSPNIDAFEHNTGANMKCTACHP